MHVIHMCLHGGGVGGMEKGRRLDNNNLGGRFSMQGQNVHMLIIVGIIYRGRLQGM